MTNVAVDAVPLLAETEADFAVAVALVIADASSDWYPVRACDGARSLHEEVSRGELFPAHRWLALQRLWYRWLAPDDRVDPMRWYLAGLAAARHDDQSTISAQVEAGLRDLAAMPPAQRPGHIAALAGTGDAPPVLAGETSTDDALDLMLGAAREGRPLLWTDGGAPRVPHEEALNAWSALAPAERAALLVELHDRFAVLGPVRIHVVGQALDNESGCEAIMRCREHEPAAWSLGELTFATVLWLWELSAVSFTELNQADVDLIGLERFLVAKHERYGNLVGYPSPPPAHLLELARAVAALRARVERDHVRCFRIDGGTWERREHLLPIAAVAPDAVPAQLARHVRDMLGVELPASGDWRERWTGLVDRLCDAGVNPAEALVALAEYLLLVEDLRADYAIVTAARGPKLDAPWTLELPDVFSYCALRPGCDWRERGVRLTDVKIRDALCQRMRHNVTRRARNYSPDRDERLKAQPFQFPDVALMEDAHHGGHRASGIRFAARSPYQLKVPGVGTWRGLADVRINRASYDPGDAYTFAELPAVIRVAWWAKTVVEASLARGVDLDPIYGRKLTARGERELA
ncbi:MAG: hypothetical protein QOJ29_1827 [Thermoleophilaceae bacterium]|jgi:hypothetical protein|nr:hypothetical protein [Thermoleophilaceae bacterium]